MIDKFFVCFYASQCSGQSGSKVEWGQIPETEDEAKASCSKPSPRPRSKIEL